MNYKKIHFLILIVLAIIVYANSLKNDFTYDDHEIITENFHFKNIPAYKWIFNGNYFNYSKEFSYRPLVTISYLIDFYLFKLNPFGYHLTNLLLHLLVVIFIYLFFCLLTKDSDIAFLTSLIFSVHTINSEAVNSIGFREDMLCALFYIIAFYTYINFIENKRFSNLIIAMLSLFLSLFSKEMAISFPLMIIIYDFYFKKESIKIKAIIKRYLPLFLVIIIYVLIRFFLMKNPIRYIPAHPEELTAKRLLLIPEVLCRYIFLLFLPVKLSAVHTYLISDYKFHITFIPYTIILIGVIVTIIYMRKYNRYLSFGLTFFLITLLPVINIIPIGHLLAERFLYLSNIGFCLFLTSLILLIKNSNIRKYIFLIILIFFSLLTYNRNKVWSNDESLWKATIKNSPNSYRAYNGLGLVYYNNREYDKAEELFKKSIELEEFYEVAYINLGLTYTGKGELNNAIAVFSDLLKLNPKNDSAYLNLGIVYAKANLRMKALDCFKKSAELQPLNPAAYNNIGLVYAGMGLKKEAIEMFKKSIHLDPNYSEAHFNLGTAYALSKNFDEAIKEYEITLKIDPKHTLAIRQLGLAKQELKRQK